MQKSRSSARARRHCIFCADDCFARSAALQGRSRIVCGHIGHQLVDRVSPRSQRGGVGRSGKLQGFCSALWTCGGTCARGEQCNGGGRQCSQCGPTRYNIGKWIADSANSGSSVFVCFCHFIHNCRSAAVLEVVGRVLAQEATSG